MICIIVHKYTFVNSFLNIFANLFILLLIHIVIIHALCTITIFCCLTKCKPPVSGRCARVRISFYALFMHNILFFMNRINYSPQSKSFPYYHNHVVFASVSVKIPCNLWILLFIHRIFMLRTGISSPIVLLIHPSDST